MRNLEELVKESYGELTHPRRPVGPTDHYLDPSEAPREGYGATILKNMVNAAMAASPDPVEIDMPANEKVGLKASKFRIDPAFGMASMGKLGKLAKEFAGSRVGKMTQGNKPWEMSPDDWVRFMRDKADPNFERNLKALEQAPNAQGIDATLDQKVSPRQNYAELTGARAVDIAGGEDPQMINRVLSRLEGIETPGLSVANHWPQEPTNFRSQNKAPSVRWPHQQFPWMPAYGAYGADTNQILLLKKPHSIVHPNSDQGNMLASTLAHEVEHAADYQKGRFREKSGFERYLEQHDPRYSNPETTVREIDATSLPRGPMTWMGLTEPRAELLKSFGKLDGKPSKFAPARSPKNQYDLKFLQAQNPRAVEQIGSRGHFATLDNFETDWALKNMAKQAMSEGLEVNPAILEAFPDLRKTKIERPMAGWESIRPKK